MQGRLCRAVPQHVTHSTCTTAHTRHHTTKASKSVYLSVCLYCCLSVCLPARLCVWVWVCVSICLPASCLPVFWTTFDPHDYPSVLYLHSSDACHTRNGCDTYTHGYSPPAG